MKKSLEALFQTFNVKVEPMNFDSRKSNDFELLKEAKEIKDSGERISFLKKSIDRNTNILFNSKIYLIELLMDKEPEQAFNLAQVFSINLINHPFPYILMGKIAVKQKSLFLAKNVLEIAIWLSCNLYSAYEKEANKLLQDVLRRIAFKEPDCSNDEKWKSKPVNKAMTFLFLRNGLSEEKLYEYSVRLFKIFPGVIENYDMVFQLLYLIEDKAIIKRFLDFVNKDNHLEHTNKNLCKGICYYHLLELNDSINNLQEVLSVRNGDLNAKFYLALSFLCKAEKETFSKLFLELLPEDNSLNEEIQSASPIFLGAFIIYSALKNSRPGIKELKNEKAISLQIARIFNQMISSGYKEEAFQLHDSLKKSDFFTILPSLNLYFCEFLIKKNLLSEAKEILAFSSDNEVHRLNAWIYRAENKINEAENELTIYRKNLLPGDCKIDMYNAQSLKFPNYLPEHQEEILKLLEDAYLQTKELKQEIANEYGIEQNTCFETNCFECCKSTYPIISYTEYLYLRTWLEKQSQELQNEILKKSKEVVDFYKRKYKQDPPFLSEEEANSEERSKYYPKDFKFDCPALKNGCTVFHAQPFICRAYGYTTGNRYSFNGCSYFHKQFIYATKLTPVRKIIDMFSFIDFVVKADQKLISKSIYAPIPVWFAQDHDKTIWKAERYRLSRGWFAPVFLFMTTYYFKLLDIKKERGKNSL